MLMESYEYGGLGGGVDIGVIQHWYVKMIVVYTQFICLIERPKDILVTKYYL